MYGKTLSALAVLVIISLGVVFFVWNTSSSDGKTYANSVYGYTLTYPSSLDIKEYTDDIATIGVVTPEAVDGRADVRVVTAQGEAGQTPQDAVAMQLRNLCAADGPESSFSCTGTMSTEPFTTELGEMGFVLILRGELKNLKSGTMQQIPMGPYYVLTLAHSATISKVLVVMPPLNKNAAEADAALIRGIAESAVIKK